MARSHSLAVVALGTLGAAALLLIPWPARDLGRGAGHLAAPALAEQLDARLREVAAGIDARAATLADLPRLQVAVATDAETVRNLTQDELMFKPKPGEVIEIGQIVNGAKPMTLWRSSDREGQTGLDAPLGDLGYHTSIVGGTLYLTEVVNVTPRERADELRGSLALSWPVEIPALAARVDAAHLGAQLEIDGQTLPLGATAIAGGAATTSAALQSPPGKGVSLRVQSIVAAPKKLPVALATAVFALGLVAALLVGRIGKKKPAMPATLAGADGTGEATVSATSGSPATAGAAGTSGLGLAGTQSQRDADRLAGGTARSAAHSSAALARTEMGTTGDSNPRGSASLAVEGVPSIIGRYEVMRLLGSGGMADVYLARSTGEAGFEKLIALKVLQRQFAKEPIFVEHFLDEARLASRLTHPNIVQISDLGRAGDEYFIAMEYIDGADLECLLNSCRDRGELVPPRVGMSIVRKICDGLHAAHIAQNAEGKPLELVHRDVKAANIFVAKNGVVKIGDFGIAKANQESRIKKTQLGQVKGTAAYMAPEHRSGQVVDQRADLYSVGAIAYEVFTGNEVNLDVAVIGPRGIQGWPHLPAPSTVRSDLPLELDAVIFKALAFEKTDRYDSCEALEAAFEEIANRHGLNASDKIIAQWVETSLATLEGRPSTTVSSTSQTRSR